MASIPLLGHLVPLLPIARGLASRGHEVTVLTGELLRSRVETEGVRFEPLPLEADFDGSRMLELFPNLARSDPGAAKRACAAREIFIPPIPAQYAAIQRLLGEGDPSRTVVLHEVFFHGMWPVLLGGPGLRPAGVLGLGVTVLGLSGAGIAPPGDGVLPDWSEQGIKINQEREELQRAAFAPVQALLDESLASVGVTRPAPPYWSGHALVPDRTFQLCTPGFEYPRPDLPAHVEFCGRAFDDSADIALPQWWPDVTAGDRVVFVTQGTFNNDDFEALLFPVLRALSDQDLLVVATLGGRPVPLSPAIPANARVASYLSYHQVLPHVDVFVSNGGFGGVQAALQFGVPLVVAGETEDKCEVAARVEWSGAGVNLRTGKPDEPALRSAVLTVLSEPSYVDNARRLQGEFRKYDTVELVADAVEDFAAHPRGR